MQSLLTEEKRSVGPWKAKYWGKRRRDAKDPARLRHGESRLEKLEEGRMLVVVKSIVLTMTKDLCYSDQSISPNNDKMENNIGSDGGLLRGCRDIWEPSRCRGGRWSGHRSASWSSSYLWKSWSVATSTWTDVQHVVLEKLFKDESSSYLRAFCWYSRAFLVSLVARVVYSTALSTWASILGEIILNLNFSVFSPTPNTCWPSRPGSPRERRYPWTSRAAPWSTAPAWWTSHACQRETEIIVSKRASKRRWGGWNLCSMSLMVALSWSSFPSIWMCPVKRAPPPPCKLSEDDTVFEHNQYKVHV